MNVTTITDGANVTVITEAQNGVVGSQLFVSSVTLTGASFQSDLFIGLTLSEIKQRFRLSLDGEDLITRDGTTLTSSVTGTINFGYGYTGTAFLVKF